VLDLGAIGVALGDATRRWTMRLQIFDVEHGACALLTADNNARLMIDCGNNANTSWWPGTYLRRRGITLIEMLAITNYDEDHASGAPDLFDNINVQWLLRNKSVSPAIIKLLKSEDGMGPGIDRLCDEIEQRFTTAPTSYNPEPVFDGLERRSFCVNYPTFDDENNLSLAVFLKCQGIGVMFPGDLEGPGFIELLRREDFRQAARNERVRRFASRPRKWILRGDATIPEERVLCRDLR
jgi:beta-lactamase superfamily II metal-dependent hydrolase